MTPIVPKNIRSPDLPLLFGNKQRIKSIAKITAPVMYRIFIRTSISSPQVVCISANDDTEHVRIMSTNNPRMMPIEPSIPRGSVRNRTRQKQANAPTNCELVSEMPSCKRSAYPSTVAKVNPHSRSARVFPSSRSDNPRPMAKHSREAMKTMSPIPISFPFFWY